MDGDVLTRDRLVETMKDAVRRFHDSEPEEGECFSGVVELHMPARYEADLMELMQANMRIGFEADDLELSVRELLAKYNDGRIFGVPVRWDAVELKAVTAAEKEA